MKHYPFFSGMGNEPCFPSDYRSVKGAFSAKKRDQKTLEWEWFFRTSFVFLLLVAFAIQGFSQSPVSSEKALSLYGNSLRDLVTGLNPTVVISDGTFTVAGAGSPEVVVCDGSSVAALYSGHPSFKSVKLLRINVNSPGELPAAIKLESLQGFESLQYLYFVFGYDICGDGSDGCLSAKVGSLINGPEDAVISLYKISIAQ